MDFLFYGFFILCIFSLDQASPFFTSFELQGLFDMHLDHYIIGHTTHLFLFLVGVVIHSYHHSQVTDRSNDWRCIHYTIIDSLHTFLLWALQSDVILTFV